MGLCQHVLYPQSTTASPQNRPSSHVNLQSNLRDFRQHSVSYQHTSRQRQIASPLLFSVVVVVKLVLIEETNKDRRREEIRMLLVLVGAMVVSLCLFFASVD